MVEHAESRTKVAAVTGATGAIGLAIARGLAESDRFEVVLVCRDERKASKATDQIAKQTGNRRIRYEIADLSRKGSIGLFAKRWHGPLDVLVNNAAIAPRRRTETPDGIETQLATNVLGYLWMTRELEPALAAAAKARVINVASYWAGDLDLDDLEFLRRPYDNNTAYRQSKQCNRMLTVTLAERLAPRGIVVNACHPGDVNSTLSNSLGFGGHDSPDEGAKTPLWLATDNGGLESTGKYFEHGREVPCRFASNRAAIERLYEACLRY